MLHSDNTLLANGRAMVEDWRYDEHTVLYSHSPLSHHIGTVALEQSLVAGCELVVNDLSPGTKPLDWILETGATYVMGVPTHAMDILADMKVRGLSALGAVCFGVSVVQPGASTAMVLALAFLVGLAEPIRASEIQRLAADAARARAASFANACDTVFRLIALPLSARLWSRRR